MESKEALKDIFGILINLERLSGIQDKQDIKKQKFDIIEKDLDRLEKLEKAFDIITTKNVDFKTIKTCCGPYAYTAYNSYIDKTKNVELTKEEYDLIKELL